MKYKLILASICIAGALLGFVTQYQSSTPTERRLVSRASWSQVHATVGELYSSASLVVRGKVAASKSRVISETLPIQGLTGELAERAKTVPEHTLILEQGMRERGIQGSPDQLTPEQAQEILAETTLKTEQIGEEVVHTPLTDATVQVLEVLKGKADQEIVVTQLGGPMPAAKNGTNSETAILEFSESPLLQAGDEYIVFLIENQSGDVQGQPAYELVGPSGQFKIVGTRVENAMSAEDGLGLPTDLAALLSDIRQQSK